MRRRTSEGRLKELKVVHEIAPVFLKDPFRIEVFFTLYSLLFWYRRSLSENCASR